MTVTAKKTSRIPSAEELESRISALPPEIAEVYDSSATAMIILNAGRSQGLPIDKVGDIARDVGYVILGFASTAEFISDLEEIIGDKEKTKAVAVEINQKIFLPIRESLKKIYDGKWPDDLGRISNRVIGGQPPARPLPADSIQRTPLQAPAGAATGQVADRVSLASAQPQPPMPPVATKSTPLSVSPAPTPKLEPLIIGPLPRAAMSGERKAENSGAQSEPARAESTTADSGKRIADSTGAALSPTTPTVKPLTSIMPAAKISQPEAATIDKVAPVIAPGGRWPADVADSGKRGADRVGEQKRADNEEREVGRTDEQKPKLAVPPDYERIREAARRELEEYQRAESGERRAERTGGNEQGTVNSEQQTVPELRAIQPDIKQIQETAHQKLEKIFQQPRSSEQTKGVSGQVLGVSTMESKQGSVNSEQQRAMPTIAPIATTNPKQMSTQQVPTRPTPPIQKPARVMPASSTQFIQPSPYVITVGDRWQGLEDRDVADSRQRTVYSETAPVAPIIQPNPGMRDQALSTRVGEVKSALTPAPTREPPLEWPHVPLGVRSDEWALGTRYQAPDKAENPRTVNANTPTPMPNASNLVPQSPVPSQNVIDMRPLKLPAQKIPKPEAPERYESDPYREPPEEGTRD